MSDDASEIVHATLIARRINGVWGGVLLRGRSGAGKSRLALESFSEGFSLVADDRVIVWRAGSDAYGRAPETLAGLIEVRGVGVLPATSRVNLARVALVADIVRDPAEIERTPAPETVCIAAVDVPRIQVCPSQPGGAVVLLAALAAVRRRL